jgi:hypothetical protein
MSSDPRQPSEEELRAAYEAELKRLRVEHVLLDNVAALVNLGMRRTGLIAGTEEERDPSQVRLAIEGVRALMPVLEQVAPTQVGAIRDALSQLQIAFVRIGGQPPPSEAAGTTTGADPAGVGGTAAPGEAAGQPTQPGQPAPPGQPAQPAPPKPGEPGPAQRSGRLWVPGQ